MGINIKIDTEPTQKILLKRYLNNNGQAQIKLTKECAKWMNNYVPFLHGRLKDMSVELQADKVIYNALYAKKQYYTNQGNGKQGTAHGGLRGKQWDKRMWSQRGDGIIKTIAEFVGGKAK
ncbi:minor capsid protein [Clostridium cellulovorans]|uniref:Minor capsid n=1 Tax=Clostridium cellulovorans (strain ATCC 35296 / DSM 3052 / OCM 3 / 743B) TaxID=573061 RepID=D9SWD2_CLOC7|nr:minor capsid protein [Clostridium cellulovorans]ADL53214.1 Minor capsid [Clostridium cellulovorans 743B]